MPSSKFPVGKVEIAPHVHNARYACPAENFQRDAFQYIAGYEECDGQYEIARKSYPYLILEMIISGKGKLRINDKEYEVSSGFCFCGGPEVEYEFRSSSRQPISKYFVVFGKIQASSFAPQKRLYPGFTTRYALPEEMKRWCELIIAEGSSQEADALENISALIGILVRKIAPDARGKTARQHTDALVIKALGVIERDFKTIGTLQELADSLSVSREHLCRVFKSNDKAPPYRILIRRKMEHAYAQLKMTQTPIQEIAYDLGFTDSFHFSRAFKKRYGIPPSAAR
ncbi:AraC family transcriptional regulator [Pelagicoccus mobilis]|uniref:Helix-turn-helix domain-containing protein n=1 Tax=Pelagicoccus mobilis TaxID=415221 RepID=A0A934RZ30_9BACT|nr:AraC family transcriptional regulator [Pelagicoccus mobilis]MBK1879377.1 helix-turn-helix domain-containing protein [Pelagicoccus mobilis]